MHEYYENLGLSAKFGKFQKLYYNDYQYFITEATLENNKTGEIEKQLLLCKWTLVPLAILPPSLSETHASL